VGEAGSGRAKPRVVRRLLPQERRGAGSEKDGSCSGKVKIRGALFEDFYVAAEPVKAAEWRDGGLCWRGFRSANWAEARLEADTAVRLFIAAADGDRRVRGGTVDETASEQVVEWSSGRVVECSELSFCRPRLPMTMTNQSQRVACRGGTGRCIHYSGMHLALITHLR
jgi:hypothetical protein